MVALMNKIALTTAVLILAVLMISCNSANNIRPPDSSLSVPRPVTVMSFNIRIGAGHTDFGRNPYKLKDEIELSLGSVIEAIKSIDPDIVGLQEVLGDGQAAELGKALNMNYAYVPHGIDKYGVWWGVAILSKFPIQGVTRHEISSGRGNTRSNLIADITVFGKKTKFISIHKDRDTDDGDAFRNTMNRINEFNEPVVLIGDLNMWPNDDRHDILSGRLMDTAFIPKTKTAEFARERGTYPGEDGSGWGKRIDYVMVDKDRFEVLDAGLTDEKYWEASDHLGYYTKIRFK